LTPQRAAGYNDRVKNSAVARAAVFLDRDGTLNEDTGYPGHISQVHIYPRAFAAVRMLREAGFAVVVVSSQSGIGRGFFSEAALADLHREFGAAFSRAGAALDGIYHCPHFGPPAQTRDEACPCAKPRPGLALRAAAELGLDLERSYMIGDKVDDILFGLNAGVVPVLVLTGYGAESLKALGARGLRPAHVASNVLEAAAWVVRDGKGGRGAGAGRGRRP